MTTLTPLMLNHPVSRFLANSDRVSPHLHAQRHAAHLN
ncbi:hypothetical protein J2Y00_002342 [Deinococcus soli (ex Cha et al. 2016)]|uniref:Uncharacterized protein n=2 Tax=Deinococcus soli (ex Cha et al. 2016) TaxID=1309411 RepID=A0AAE3XBI4_9DEIO|nr:hypothetical protein [Deinococcus soli (ex Cha et al. 2016)]MDR6328542.1 hypothetical protein [Deinococcus soli (ex Cha et al. 2016)]MDR6753153.1 hypothetical protein [Deinococcus soli (ex Cha et al. 2016)]